MTVETHRIATMVEVFKTNVCKRAHAQKLVDRIERVFAHYSANFDLDDCDKILRVKCNNGSVETASVINLVREFGFVAEILPDEVTGHN